MNEHIQSMRPPPREPVETQAPGSPGWFRVVLACLVVGLFVLIAAGSWWYLQRRVKVSSPVETVQHGHLPSIHNMVSVVEAIGAYKYRSSDPGAWDASPQPDGSHVVTVLLKLDPVAHQGGPYRPARIGLIDITPEMVEALADAGLELTLELTFKLEARNRGFGATGGRVTGRCQSAGGGVLAVEQPSEDITSMLNQIWGQLPTDEAVAALALLHHRLAVGRTDTQG